MEATTVQPKQQVPAKSEHAPKAAANSPRRAGTLTILVLALVVLVPLAYFLKQGIDERSNHNSELAATASQVMSTPPQVYVVQPVASAAANLSLPGTTQAIQDATIYARVSGFLTKRYVDIGDPVMAGQLLAEIESPELEAQLNQAKANLEQASKQLDQQNANLELAQVTLKRYQDAGQDGAVSKLVIDQSVAALQVAQASVAAAQATIAANEANVRQYEAMTAFERVLAPFDGVITQRNVDVGALITSGSPVNNTSVAPTSVTGAATGLFEVSQFDTLRVFVSVPQITAKNVKVGISAQVTTRSALNAPVAATVTRTANALDPGSRTLLVEVDIPNASHVMFPGEFVYVAFQLKPNGQRWTLPATALIANANGTQVMMVDPEGKLRLQNVTVGRDFGDTIDILLGLSGSETIVKQPDVSLQAGQIVTPVNPEEATHAQ